MKILSTCFLIFLTFVFFSNPAMARDLVEAAQTAQSMFNRIGIAAIGIGLTIGGICFALGAAQIGRMVLVSGFIGAAAILGGPSLLNLLGRVFGASV